MFDSLCIYFISSTIGLNFNLYSVDLGFHNDIENDIIEIFFLHTETRE